MQSFGLDLSTDPRKAWWSIIEWSGARPRVIELECAASAPAPSPAAPSDTAAEEPATTEREPRDTTLARTLAAALAAFNPGPGRVAGIDAPLGWPVDFVEAVQAWTHDPGACFTKRPELRLRATDRFVQAATGLTPMSVSTDRIGSTAMLAAHTLSLLAERTGQRGGYDRARATNGVAEVYPAAALRVWTTEGDHPLGLVGYKASAAARELLVTRLATVVDLSPQQVVAMVGSDDALDAVVCALIAGATARGAVLGVDEPVDAGDLPPGGRVEEAEALRQLGASDDRAAREGWIQVPRGGPLSALLN